MEYATPNGAKFLNGFDYKDAAPTALKNGPSPSHHIQPRQGWRLHITTQNRDASISAGRSLTLPRIKNRVERGLTPLECRQPQNQPFRSFTFGHWSDL